ncbi:hypothetical protein MA16_Dca017803 [Dendrobium catenatum]|uniref:Uncharacterized protein n=1 Tax=Dendrobium catenatum TaxID=906689 RepID=A0A2I0VD94_9ASPA|nr:hypothetical protein MA16_Dca017803 [Dendrobium catenatum]
MIRLNPDLPLCPLEAARPSSISHILYHPPQLSFTASGSPLPPPKASYSRSSSIKIHDEKTGAIYTVDAHNLSSTARSLDIGKFITVLIICLMFHLFH